MKDIYKILIVCVFLACACAATPTWTTPTKVHVSAFAVNDYSNYSPSVAPSLSRSVITKDTFIASLFSELNDYYPGLSRCTPYNYNDSNVTVCSYKGALTYHSEFVFFAGHGHQQRIVMHDLPMKVYEGCAGDTCSALNYGKVYGGNTRWVIFNSCLTLNVNKSNMLSYPLTLESVDLSRVDTLRTVFHGVHAILGYYALTWAREFPIPYYNEIIATENLYKFFAKNFISYNETIWDSFVMANMSVYYQFVEVLSDYGLDGPAGLKPAIAFLRGYDENGVYHDTSLELFNHTYNQPININGSLELFIMYYELGEPLYSFL